MGDPALWLRLGFTHIADVSGYDHLLFVTALTVAYPPSAWRPLAVLVTAFTVGHSVTLALATTGVVSVPGAWVEAAIPATIAATALVTLWHTRTAASGGQRPAMLGRYLLAAGFGLIHGLGFSSYLRSLLGDEDSIVAPLFWFNVGLEAGQLAIVAVVLAAGVAATRVIPATRWVQGVSAAAALAALPMLAGRLGGP